MGRRVRVQCGRTPAHKDTPARSVGRSDPDRRHDEFSSKSYFLGSTEDLHLVERFTRIAEGTIEYKITATDPSICEQAWSAVILLKQTKDKIYEFACHEGTYEVVFDMLAGARIPK